MTPFAIIPTFYPVEQVTASLLPRSIAPSLDTLDLQGTEEALNGCVVEIVPCAANAASYNRQFKYNGKIGTLAITFHPTGIKALAGKVK